MPKLPVLSGEELIAALQRGGFSIMRQKGSKVIHHLLLCDLAALRARIRAQGLVG